MPSLSQLLRREPAYQPLRRSWGTITLYPTRFELYQAAFHVDRKRMEPASAIVSPPSGLVRSRAPSGGKLSPSEEFVHSSDMVSLLIFLNSSGLGQSARDPLLPLETMGALVNRRPDQGWRAFEAITLRIDSLGNHVWGERSRKQQPTTSWPREPLERQRQQLLRRRRACHRLLKGLNLSVRRERDDRDGTLCEDMPDAQARAIALTPDNRWARETLCLWLVQGNETAVQIKPLPQPHPSLGFWGALEQIGWDLGHSLKQARFQQKTRTGAEQVGKFRRSTCVLQRAWLEQAAAKAPWAAQALRTLLDAREGKHDGEVVICLQRRGPAPQATYFDDAVHTELQWIFGCRQRRQERDAKLVAYLDQDGKPVRFAEFRRYVDPKGHLDPHDWSLSTW